jgi:hypothetical protein
LNIERRKATMSISIFSFSGWKTFSHAALHLGSAMAFMGV